MLILLACVPLAHGSGLDPIGKVIQMLNDLHAKVSAEGAEATKVYEEYAAWCQDREANLDFEIKTGKSNADELNAQIVSLSSKAEALTAKIEELASKIAEDEANLAQATKIRGEEAALFAAEDKELSETIDTLQRAITIIEKEMAGGASMLQFQNLHTVAQALSTLVDAQQFNSADASRLTALMQSESSDDDTGAPDPAAYKSQSGGIVATLEGLLEKAQSQQAESRSKETSAAHNFELLSEP